MEYSTETIKQYLIDKGINDVSEEAVSHFGDILELFAGYITEEAVGRAHEDGRKVVTKTDIEKALD